MHPRLLRKQALLVAENAVQEQESWGPTDVKFSDAGHDPSEQPITLHHAPAQSLVGCSIDFNAIRYQPMNPVTHVHYKVASDAPVSLAQPPAPILLGFPQGVGLGAAMHAYGVHGNEPTASYVAVPMAYAPVASSIGHLQACASRSAVSLSQTGCSKEKSSRMKWTPELHNWFLHAVEEAGGFQAATPKAILSLMKVPGLSIYHVKSHLQKHRTHRRIVRDGGRGKASQNNDTDTEPGTDEQKQDGREGEDEVAGSIRQRQQLPDSCPVSAGTTAVTAASSRYSTHTQQQPPDIMQAGSMTNSRSKAGSLCLLDGPHAQPPLTNSRSVRCVHGSVATGAQGPQTASSAEVASVRLHTEAGEPRLPSSSSRGISHKDLEQALAIQVDLQKQLQDQLEGQRQLQQSLAAHQRYITLLMEKQGIISMSHAD